MKSVLNMKMNSRTTTFNKRDQRRLMRLSVSNPKLAACQIIDESSIVIAYLFEILLMKIFLTSTRDFDKIYSKEIIY